MISGETINVALNPMSAKHLLDGETAAPVHLELRNGLRTDAGFYKGRPGYVTNWSLGVSQPVTLLIPHKRTVDPQPKGFAVTEAGTIYELYYDRTSQLLTGPTLSGVFRPTWCQFDLTTIIADGQAMVKIPETGTTVALLGGNPPAAKFCSVLADRVIVSGYDATGFQWSGPGNCELWPAENFANITGHGESIRFQHVKDTDLYFFKDSAIEIWAHIGGREVFGRRGIVTVFDKFAVNRGIQGYSVVQANKTFFFFGGGAFYMLNGFQTQEISGHYKRELSNLLNVSDAYGFHFSKEHVIRWFFPTAGRCFVYDYVNQVFTEDNLWVNGELQRLPIYAYMEMDGQAYVGSYDPLGLVSTWNDDIYTDNGVPIHLLRRLRIPLSPKGHSSKVNRLRIRMKRGTGGSTAATENMLVRWAFDEGPWEPYASVVVGNDGDHNPYVDVPHPAGTQTLGSGKEMKLEISQHSNAQHLLTHLQLTVKELGR